jgi:hypothetical protein
MKKKNNNNEYVDKDSNKINNDNNNNNIFQITQPKNTYQRPSNPHINHPRRINIEDIQNIQNNDIENIFIENDNNNNNDENIENNIDNNINNNIDNNIDNNLKIDDIVDNSNNKDGNYSTVKETKIRNLPGGGKEIEITEKTEVKVERPVYRGNRYRFSKRGKEEEEANNEDAKSETKPTYYRIRRPRGSEQSNKTEEQQISMSKVEVEDNKEIIIPKRYHRRYRDSKTSSNNEN